MKKGWFKKPLNCKNCGKFIRYVEWPLGVNLPPYHCNDCPPLEAKMASQFFKLIGR